MIYIGSKRKFFDRYRADFAKWNESRKPVQVKSLELVFTDMNGKNYYRFPEGMLIPIERWGKAKDYMQWMAAGISPVELDKLLDFAERSLDEGIKKGKGMARVGFALQELRDRRNMIIHTELIYNFLAVHWVREDEQPEVIDEQIHREKVEQFKREVIEGDTYFFFHQAELKKIYEPFNLSQSELTAYLQDSIVKQEALKKMLLKYSSQHESEEVTTDGNRN